MSNASMAPLKYENYKLDSLNFSSEPLGVFPSSENGFSFTVLNHSNNYNISVVNTQYGKALNIWSSPNDGIIQWTTLGINLPSSGDANISFTFSWNYNNNYLNTISNIALASSGGKMLDQNFGSARGLNDTVTGVEKYTVGKMPPIGQRLTDNLTVGGSNKEPVLFSMGNGHNQSIGDSLPIFPLNFSGNGGLSLDIGGPYCNITIYAISISNGTSGMFPVYGGYDSSMKEKSLGYFPELGSKSTDFRYDELDNSLIFVNRSTFNVEELNLNNQSLRVLSSARAGYEFLYAMAGYGIYSVFYSNQSSTTVTRINESNMTVSSRIFNFSLHGNISVLQESSDLYGILTDDSAILLNLKGKLASFMVNGSLPLSASFVNGVLKTIRYSQQDREVYSYEINSTTDSMFHKVQTEIAEFPSYNYSFSFENDTCMMSVSRSVPGNGNFLNENLTGIYLGSGIESAALFQSSVIFSNASRYYILNSSGYYSLNLSSNMRYMASHNDSIFFMENGNIKVLYEGAYPFINGSISVSISQKPFYSGNSSEINISVHSESPWTIIAFIDQVEFPVHNSIILFNPENLNNGSSVLSLTVNNSVGNSYIFRQDIFIDNYRPRVNFNSSTNAISAGSNVSFSIQNVPDNYVNNISVNGFFLSREGSYYLFHVPSASGGNMTINITIRDLYGRILNIKIPSFIIPKIPVSNLSLLAGSFLSSGYLNLKWPSVSGASNYTVNATGINGMESFASENTTEFIQLGNGRWNVIVNAVFPDGVRMVIARANFTVMTFTPHITALFNRTNASFFGNSRSNITLQVASNITSSVKIRIDGPNNLPVNRIEMANVTFAVLNLRSIKNTFHQNGTYIFNIKATDKAGLSSSENLSLNVNNTMPSLSYLKKRIYTNERVYRLDLQNSSGGYFVTLVVNHTGPSPVLNTNGSVSFSGNYSSVVLNITYVNSFGNWNSRNLRMVYSNVPPVVSINEIRYMGNGSYMVNYSSSSPVNETITFSLGTSVVYNTSIEAGHFLLNVSHNGNYSIRIVSRDICGNLYTSVNSNLTVKAFPQVSSMRIEASNFPGFGLLKVVLRGYILNDVSVRLYLNGRKLGGTNGLLLTILPGYYNVSAVAQYDGHRVIRSVSIFSTGILPEVVIAVAISILYLDRNYRGSRDADVIMEYLMSMGIIPIRTLIKEARRKGVSRAAIRKFLKGESGKYFEVRKDPDGDMYLYRKNP
ncbi:MAG: hypothetical protein M1431_05350 [Candidatus Thermoplasmatota archaeon]|nr:hypothetical protein [Candidatus Thermoplasmatota archaeon]